MTLATVRAVLLWSAVINYGILVVWFLVFLLAHDGIYSLHGRWFHVSREQFDALHYAAMAVYKIGVLLFNLVPYLALRIAGRPT